MMTYQNFKEMVIAALTSYMPEKYQEMQIICRKQRHVNQEQDVLECSIPNAHVNTVGICLTDAYVHIAKLNGRLCGAKRPHSVSEQPNFYQSLQSNPYNDSSHPSGGE